MQRAQPCGGGFAPPASTAQLQAGAAAAGCAHAEHCATARSGRRRLSALPAAAPGGSPGGGSPAAHGLGSALSDDPSNLRWGSTGLRSSIIIASPESLHQAHSSLSAGRTPLAARVAQPLARGRAPSAEAESPAAYHHGVAAAAAAAAAGEAGAGGSCPLSCKPVRQPRCCTP